MAEEVATWLIGDYRIDKVVAKHTGDENVVLEVWLVGLDKPGVFSMSVQQAKDMAGFLTAAALMAPPEPITVHFKGGPWDGQTTNVERVVGPVFAVGHQIGNHYWLDTKSAPPTYFWDANG